MTAQSLVPGIIGFAPATDHVYLDAIQRAAAEPSGDGLVNRLRLVYATLDTDRFFALDEEGRTDEAERLIAQAARSLRDAGADFLVVTSNTGSVIAEGAGLDLPLLDIFATTIDAALSAGARRLGLLSTRRTLESGRYQRSAEQHGASVLAAPDGVVTQIDRMIDQEASRGITTDASLKLLQDTVGWFADHGADAVILGCTDLLLFGVDAIGRGLLPVIDSTIVHATEAARRAGVDVD
ncbi:aspartate/glutamate racemase family protein [Gryllotalpicola ginsengisoli]|uniref:aspartate/glutamate racemase family protein n=1 Tax=Gryllotalpicola ginsengisoli TaxID=444608 RepID=UPI0003B7B6BE|nr:aspartate/glutamate racemase family protein [Gryllotalpicola ginsengisoli]